MSFRAVNVFRGLKGGITIIFVLSNKMTKLSRDFPNISFYFPTDLEVKSHVCRKCRSLLKKQLFTVLKSCAAFSVIRTSGMRYDITLLSMMTVAVYGAVVVFVGLALVRSKYRSFTTKKGLFAYRNLGKKHVPRKDLRTLLVGKRSRIGIGVCGYCPEDSAHSVKMVF